MGGTPYEGSLVEWITKQGFDKSLDELITLAATERKGATRKQITQARFNARRRSGMKPLKRGKKAKASKSNGRNAQVELLSDSEVRLQLDADEGPPAKHTALRRLILDVGME